MEAFLVGHNQGSQVAPKVRNVPKKKTLFIISHDSSDTLGLLFSESSNQLGHVEA